MLSDPVAEAFGLIHRHPSGQNFWRVAKGVLTGLKPYVKPFLRMEKKNEISVLLTGLRIYTGESKARGPHNALSSVGPWDLYSPV